MGKALARSRVAAVGLLALAWLPASGCHRPGSAKDDDVQMAWRMTPATAIQSREAVGEVTLLDRSRRPILGAIVQVEGHMQHPGMAPVIEPAREQGRGVYLTHLSFPMSGAWEVWVTGSLPDGRRLRRRVGVVTVAPPR